MRRRVPHKFNLSMAASTQSEIHALLHAIQHSGTGLDHQQLLFQPSLPFARSGNSKDSVVSEERRQYPVEDMPSHLRYRRPLYESQITEASTHNVPLHGDVPLDNHGMQTFSMKHDC